MITFPAIGAKKTLVQKVLLWTVRQMERRVQDLEQSIIKARNELKKAQEFYVNSYVCTYEAKKPIASSCINCHASFRSTSYSFGPSTPPGAVRKEVGPFCEACYKLVFTHCRGEKG